jgi:hypothetical protein
MPGKHKPRKNKYLDPLVSRVNTSKSERKVSTFENDRFNEVKNMSNMDMIGVTSLIRDRFSSAKHTTHEIAAKMDLHEKQYEGEWEDEENNQDEYKFFPKTKEQVKTVYSYLMLLVSQLDPIVTVEPSVRSIQHASEEYRRAKLIEAFLGYYFNTAWSFKTDILPRWLMKFLKYSMAVWKVTYVEDDNKADLKLDVVDRAFLFIDPYAKDIKDAGWVYEESLWSRSDVIDMIMEKHWHLPEREFHKIVSGDASNIQETVSEDTMKRFLGKNWNTRTNIEEDDLVLVGEYWQAPVKGRDDRYAVFLGGVESGTLVRYGRNPFPYKGLPYRGKSYSINEERPDGKGLVEEYRPYQQIINTLLNYRLEDVRKNVNERIGTLEDLVTETTLNDFESGQSLVRLNGAMFDKDSNVNLRNYFVPLTNGTSTQELLSGDIPSILQLGDSNSFISEVFKGQSPSGAPPTLGQLQEQLSRNQGVFKPIYDIVMRSIEEVAEIAIEYFKDPDFFPENRVVQIMGKNKYESTIKGFYQIPSSNISVREISPDEMDVDTIIDAVSGADSIASRTFLISSLEQTLRAIGQVPQMADILNQEVNFVKLFQLILDKSGHDVEALLYTESEKQQRQQEEQQKQQQAIQQQMQVQQQQQQMQAQLDAQRESTRQQARAQSQIAIDSNKSDLHKGEKTHEISLLNEAQVSQIITRISQELKADLQKMTVEAELESSKGVQVGHGNDISGKEQG